MNARASTEPARPIATRRLLSWPTVRSYPVPFLAAAGLALGAILALANAPYHLASWVWLGTLVAGGVPLVVGTIRRVFGGRFASDIIAAIAIVAAMLLDQAFAGVIIVLMQAGGEALESYAFRRASSALDGLLRRAPRTTQRRTADGIETVDVDRVRPGDVLTIRSGDLLPVDGFVASAHATIDESAVTGEPLPRSCPAGERVLSGSVNVGEPFDLRSEKTAGESQYAKIVELVRSAQERKPAIQRLADRYATWFTPAALAVAAWAWFYTHTPVAALAVLVVATPCPLILATPIAVIGAIDRASDHGLVVKSGGAIEQLGQSRAVLFDKTGTITVGQPEVERVATFGSVSATDVLGWAASLEQLSSHPLATSVVREAKGRGAELLPVTEPHEFPGAGIAGAVGGHRVVVGSQSLCGGELGRSLDPEHGELERSGPLGGRLVAFVLVDRTPAGALVFSDRLRPEAVGLASRLRSLGVRYTAIVTGDRRENALAVAAPVGVDAIVADLLPEQKVEKVGEARRKYGPTVMVGDGINDAAALAAASVGVAMAARGAGISAEAADVVVLVDDVGRVGDGIELGQRMLRVARQGILFGLGASIVLMVVASVGAIPPAWGALLQEVIDVAVIFNALRVRYGSAGAATPSRGRAGTVPG